ncbi:pentatricopeptide repeat-containing protein At5g66520-like [Aristolochia californica]|uniref:pentatricopeptide repeat-containing protein At5g66520-like n=1 Tax=Aristolochia californica TaxID=171875 RepID=UPI0035E3327B
MRDLKRIHSRLLRNGLQQNNLILAKVLRFAAVSPSGDLRYARCLFSQIHRPNTFFYNTIIRGYAKSPSPSQSISLFRHMRLSSVPPDEFTFTFVLKACSRESSSSSSLLNESHPQLSTLKGTEIHGQLLKFGLGSHLFVLNSLIHLYSVYAFPAAARRVFDEIYVPDVVSWSGLVVAHVKARQLENARRIFEEMPERDVVSWTTMISGCAKEGHSKEALQLFSQMQTVGVRPDEVTMVSAVAACASLGDLAAGLTVHQYAVNSGFSWMVSLGNALIDMYSKCGCLHMARQVFDNMERKSLISWNSIISACSIHGMAEDAITLFEKMLEEGVRPDGVTFLGVLNACSHKGWVEKGRCVFQNMQSEHGIEAGIEHYGCMVDMLGRAGRLEEAYRLITSMSIPSNDVVWGALLGACGIHANVEMGEQVVKKLIELKPDEGGYYVILCNIYDAAGRQAEAMMMRETMKDRGAKKTPGCSRVGT